VGIGFGKANEVPDAIRKSVESAKKNLYKVNINKNTVPHEIVGKYKSARVILKPATPGTGLIAGGPVRAVVERAGIADVLAKSLGSRNPLNIVKATIDGLLQMRTLKEAADMREVTLKKLWGSKV
jgi:small subunit ribosomal protein S5